MKTRHARAKTARIARSKPDSMATTGKPRRSHGTGSLFIKTLADGSEIWYGRWYSGGRRIGRRIGPRRSSGNSVGLNRVQAEADLRLMMLRERPPPAGAEVPFSAAAELMLRDLEARGRKPTTLYNYRSILRATLLPRIGDVAVGRATAEEVEAIATDLLDEGKAARTRAGVLKLLSQIFAYAERREWCRDNPCRNIPRPQIRESSEIRYLDQRELEALLAAVDSSAKPFGPVDKAIILTAAMTGMRQGELLALRWQDVDWAIEKIRVRHNYVRGHWMTPKSRSGERAIPLSARVSDALKRHQERSSFSAAGDLVFADPRTGEVLSHSPLDQRFKKALKAAEVRHIRFHDLRHTFGTRLAAAGVPMRMLQEWMGHRDYRTTLVYADYEPRENESAMLDNAFGAP
jgi:integrase